MLSCITANLSLFTKVSVNSIVCRLAYEVKNTHLELIQQLAFNVNSVTIGANIKNYTKKEFYQPCYYHLAA